MKLQVKLNVSYVAWHSEAIEDVLDYLESPAWVRLVLREVVSQLNQISPTDSNELTKMVCDAISNSPRAEQETMCAICMEREPLNPARSRAKAVAPLELPCGHSFHLICAQSWLKRRSTCPLCRFQLPKAYTGTFTIAAVRSTLLLPSEHDGLSPSQLLTRSVGDRMLQAAVTIIMTRISTVNIAQRRRPCQVSVAMLHANGSLVLMPVGRNAWR